MIIGALVVVASVIGGYTFHGGYLMVLWQPAEFIIIVGSAIGATNSNKVVATSILSAIGSRNCPRRDV